MKYLAAEADARWDAKPRYIDAPGQTTGQPVAALQSQAAQGAAPSAHGAQSAGEDTQNDAIASDPEQERSQQHVSKEPAKGDPWKQHRRGGPSEKWQPTAWTPPSSKR